MVENELYYSVPNLMVASLSILGSLMVLFCYTCLPKRLATGLRNDATSNAVWRKILLSLSFWDFVHSLFYCLQWGSSHYSDTGCALLGMVGIFSISSSALWTASIAHYLQNSVTFAMGGVKLPREWWLYIVICWGYPVIVVGTIFALHFGDHPRIMLCTTADCFGCFLTEEEVVLRVVAVYIPLWGSWVFVVAMYAWSYYRLSNLSEYQTMTNFRRRLLLVPVVYIAIRIPETVFRAYEFSGVSIENNTFVQILNVLQSICNPSQGFCNFILFLGAPKFRTLIWDAICDVLLKCCQMICCYPYEKDGHFTDSPWSIKSQPSAAGSNETPLMSGPLATAGTGSSLQEAKMLLSTGYNGEDWI